jgi:putative hydrolase of HD superfamily
MRALYAEMEARETLEAKIYKALDSMEAVISHNEADLATWTENEYELNLRYGYDKAAFSPLLTAIRDAVRDETLAKLEAGK